MDLYKQEIRHLKISISGDDVEPMNYTYPTIHRLHQQLLEAEAQVARVKIKIMKIYEAEFLNGE